MHWLDGMNWCCGLSSLAGTSVSCSHEEFDAFPIIKGPGVQLPSVRSCGQAQVHPLCQQLSTCLLCLSSSSLGDMSRRGEQCQSEQRSCRQSSETRLLRHALCLITPPRTPFSNRHTGRTISACRAPPGQQQRCTHLLTNPPHFLNEVFLCGRLARRSLARLPLCVPAASSLVRLGGSLLLSTLSSGACSGRLLGAYGSSFCSLEGLLLTVLSGSSRCHRGVRLPTVGSSRLVLGLAGSSICHGMLFVAAASCVVTALTLSPFAASFRSWVCVSSRAGKPLCGRSRGCAGCWGGC